MKLVTPTGLVSLALLLLSGCTSIPKMSETQLVQLPAAPMAPTAKQLKEQMNGTGQKIVITPLETTQKVQQPFTAQTYEQLTQRMMRSGNTIVDRSLAKKLRAELLAAEKSGVYKGSSPDVADIALMSTIAKLSYGKDYTEAKHWTDDDGKYHRLPPFCTYTGHAQINVRAYRMPEMKLINTYEYQGNSSTTKKDVPYYCPIGRGTLQGLLSAALTDAVKSGSGATMNDVAPPAYVLERRDQVGKSGKVALYRITINASKGARKGAKVKFFRKDKRENPITHEIRYENLLLGSGQITEYIDSTGSYVFVDDENVINQLRVGDIVKLDHGKCDPGEMEFLGQCLKLN